MIVNVSKVNFKLKDKEGNEKEFESKAITPTLDESETCMDLYCTRVSTAQNTNGKLILTYHTDLNVEVPEGHIGIVCAKPTISNVEEDFVSGIVLVHPGNKEEITVDFKITTDVIPALYREGEAFAQMFIVPVCQLQPEMHSAEEELANTPEEGPVPSTKPNTNDNEAV